MKQFTIFLSLLLIFITAFDPALAFQGGDGKTSKPGVAPKPTPTPKPTPAPKSSAGASEKPKRNPPAAPKRALSAELTINASLEGCAVSLNAKPRGNTNKDGSLNLSKLSPGSYTLTVSKAGYESHESQIEIAAGQSQVVEVTLAPLPVKLAISASVPDARIEVNGQSYTGAADLQLLPGTHQITISRSGYRTVKREIELLPARPEKLSVTLERAPIEALLAQAEQDFKQQLYDRVVATCSEIVSAEPDHPSAVLLLGQSYFNLKKHDDSVFYLVKAVRLGEQAILPLKHQHNSANDLCSGQLVIRREQLEFRSSVTDHSFISTWNRLYELNVESQRTLPRLRARVGVLKGKKENKQNFNFALAQSDCQDCRSTVDAVYQVLQQLRK